MKCLALALILAGCVSERPVPTPDVIEAPVVDGEDVATEIVKQCRSLAAEARALEQELEDARP